VVRNINEFADAVQQMRASVAQLSVRPAPANPINNNQEVLDLFRGVADAQVQGQGCPASDDFVTE
jgi:hypothetical protein